MSCPKNCFKNLTSCDLTVKKNLCVKCSATIKSLDVTCDATVGRNLTVIRDVSARNICSSGEVQVNSIVPKSGGTVTVTGDLTVTGDINADILNGVTACFDTILTNNILPKPSNSGLTVGGVFLENGLVSGTTGCFSTEVQSNLVVPKTGDTVTVGGLQLGPNGLNNIFSFNYPPVGNQNVLQDDSNGFTAANLTSGLFNTHHIYNGPTGLAFDVKLFIQNDGLTADTINIKEYADPNATVPVGLTLGTVVAPASTAGFLTVNVSPTLETSLWVYTNVDNTFPIRLYSVKNA